MNKYCPNCDSFFDESSGIILINGDIHTVAYCPICKSNLGIFFID